MPVFTDSVTALMSGTRVSLSGFGNSTAAVGGAGGSAGTAAEVGGEGCGSGETTGRLFAERSGAGGAVSTGMEKVDSLFESTLGGAGSSVSARTKGGNDVGGGGVGGATSAVAKRGGFAPRRKTPITASAAVAAGAVGRV